MFKFIKEYWAIFALWIMFMFFIIMGLWGCASHKGQPVDPTPVHNFTKTPASLHNTSVSLDWLIVMSILGLSAGIALYFFLPAAHKISGLLVCGGGSTLGLSLVLKTTLWLIPWLSGGLILLGFGVLVYEVILKLRKQNATN